MEVRMEYYLILAAVMFFAGVYGFITRRNLIAVLISWGSFWLKSGWVSFQEG